jgi:hypothetical protein
MQVCEAPENIKRVARKIAEQVPQRELSQIGLDE